MRSPTFADNLESARKALIETDTELIAYWLDSFDPKSDDFLQALINQVQSETGIRPQRQGRTPEIFPPSQMTPLLAKTLRLCFRPESEDALLALVRVSDAAAFRVRRVVDRWPDETTQQIHRLVEAGLAPDDFLTFGPSNELRRLLGEKGMNTSPLYEGGLRDYGEFKTLDDVAVVINSNDNHLAEREATCAKRLVMSMARSWFHGNPTELREDLDELFEDFADLTDDLSAVDRIAQEIMKRDPIRAAVLSDFMRANPSELSAVANHFPQSARTLSRHLGIDATMDVGADFGPI